jgi:uncharacterized phage protein gp47/JayE
VLEAVDYIDGYDDDVEISSIEVLGTDDEDEEVFRERVIKSFNSKAFGGNKADYRNFIDEITGVGGCKPMRREAGSGDINIYLIDSSYGVPSGALVNTVQQAVDPTESSGEGEGMAPICHKVSIIPVVADTLPIRTTITFTSGNDATSARNLIVQAIERYFASLRAQWESNDTSDTVVRISQIESAILSLDCVVDVTDTRIKNVASNYTMSYTKIPILGEVSINV